MPSIYINDIETPFEHGETILPAVLRAGQLIPHYCYHPGLAITAQCRQCLIEVTDMGNGKPMEKLQAACSTPAADNMRISTQSAMAVEGQRLVNEFLLINHPLDCPICDQAGECDLQNFAFRYGSGHSEMEYEKRTYGWRKVGTFIALERNRCIHCSRCERFSKDIVGSHDFASYLRSHELTFDTFQDTPITHKFQGNLADICPVGCITTLDWRFKKRAWKFIKTPSVCTGCSTGCNINLEHHQNRIFRIKPRENAEVNRWWMCDAGRLNFRHFNDQRARLTTPMARVDGDLQAVNWNAAYDALRIKWEPIANAAIIAIADPNATNEELHLLNQLLAQLGKPSSIQSFIPFADDQAYEQTPRFADPFLYQLIRTDLSANRAGAQLLGWHSDHADQSLTQTLSDHPALWIVLGDPFVEHSIQRILNAETQISDWPAPSDMSFVDKDTAVSTPQRPLPSFIETAAEQSELLIWIGTHQNNWTKLADLVFPAYTAAEKYGTYVNRHGRIQRIAPAIAAPEQTRDQTRVLQELSAIMNQNGSVIEHALDTRTVLAELPAPLHALTWEQIGETGLILNR